MRTIVCLDHHPIHPLDSQEPIYGDLEFVHPFLGPLWVVRRFPRAVLDVILEDDRSHLLRHHLGAADLSERVDAVVIATRGSSAALL